MRVAKCRSCPAQVLWLDHVRTGKPAPIDVNPADDGNVLIDPDAGTYRVLAGDDLDHARSEGAPLRKNHFATCPGRQNHTRQPAGRTTSR